MTRFQVSQGLSGGGTQIPQFWNHVNSIQYNASLDEILISARNESEVWIIDHSTTTAQAASHSGGARGHGGDLLYRWGNPQEYGAGTTANEILYQQHDAQWIPAGYYGAGDILVFNNGDNRPGGNYTSIDQFTPASDGNNNYTTPATGTAYGPAADDWTWTATPPTSFYNSDIGGVQREPNGDTLINYGNKGEAWEVNPAGQIVWEYQNPCYGSGILYQGDAVPSDPHQTGGYLTAMFRCERYPLTYAAFTGKTLTPGTTLETDRDAIELHNTGTSAVTLGGMYLTNNLSQPTLWQLPTGTSIAAGGYLVFYADGQTSATTASGRHASFTLSASGGSIGLFAADGVTPLDTITYAAQAANVSYGRAADGSVWGPLANATLGTANGTLASVLAFSSTATGTYDGTTALAATLTEDGLPVANETIRFTLNGTSVGTATTNSSGIATLGGVSLAGIHAGSYGTALAAAFLGDSVYAASSGTGALSVTAAPLTITADSKSKVYGAVLPTLTASYSGFVNGDTSASLTTLPSLTTTATATSAVGTYNIIVSGAIDPNYNIRYVAGTLTVTAIMWSFDSSTASPITNNLPAGSPVSGITFNADAGGLTLNGNAVELNGDITNQSPSTQTINLPLTLIGGSRTINTATGNVTLAGGIGQSGGGWGLTKKGTGTLTLSGMDTFSGSTAVNQGTLVATSTSAVPDGTSLVVGAGGSFLFDPSQAATTAAAAGVAAAATAPAPLVALPSATATSPAEGDSVSRQVENLSYRAFGTEAPIGPMPAWGAAHRQSQSTATRAQAHDAVLRSFAIQPGVAAENAAAFWELGGNLSNAESSKKHSIDGAVDAVMVMLQRL